ncbi:MAG: prephenate dehydrogenase [Erysipelotrichaceae bacterium]|nr:prephenate dehydrogenase [Erysipelotrichaceae bacterium]
MIDKNTVITIVGLGLLGGSYAQAFARAGYGVRGIDIDEEAVSFAKEQRWITEGSTDVSLAADTDILICALYPHVFLSWVKENQHLLKPGTLITDVTGVKRSVVSQLSSILRPDIEYIACHPMAGREYKGIRYADASLFEKANFIIVPTERNTEAAIRTAEQIAQILKFKKISCLTPEQHDEMIAFLSQLTHIVAVSLMNVKDNTHLADFTGDSFRDLTRIARINEDMWPELFMLNGDYLTSEIDALAAELLRFSDLIRTGNTEEMKRLLIQSTERRKAFEGQS